jgi:membrane protease YdiL (CAAX protease family)
MVKFHFINTGYNNLRWPEIIWFCLLIIGFIVSLMVLESAIMYYIVAFLAGILFGRLWYRTKKTLQFKYFMMIIAFMIGFIAGNYFSKYGNPILTILIYLTGIVISYYLHKNNLMTGIDI